MLPPGRPLIHTSPLWMDAYLAWVNAWLLTPKAMHDVKEAMSLHEMAGFFNQDNLSHLLTNEQLTKIIMSFRSRVHSKEILLGGRIPPSCDETNVLTPYDPGTRCTCRGLYPWPAGGTLASIQQQSDCAAINKMIDMTNLVIEQEDEWNPRDLFTSEDLKKAVAELVLANADEQAPPQTCLGSMSSLGEIRAADRRPNPNCDTERSVFYQLYPINERIKIFADAKWFLAMACGGGIAADGLMKAVADAANNILIADYCEALDEQTLSLLQTVGAAATALLKLCNLAGVVTDWQFNNFVALTIQFSVLGHYRDHSRSRRPGGVYGSRMTGRLSHRYIDLALYVGVLAASIGTGMELTRDQYILLAEACSYINDLVDFRSDTIRKLRENVILRGVRGNICRYLDDMISSCLRASAKAIRSSPVNALVLMSLSNWMLMGSQHKVYELLHGIKTRNATICRYTSDSDGSYKQLCEALAEYGTLGAKGPNVMMRRMDMDLLYHSHRTSPDSHQAWLADSSRSLLHPTTLRRIIDVVHFEWLGETGDVEYCP